MFNFIYSNNFIFKNILLELIDIADAPGIDWSNLGPKTRVGVDTDVMIEEQIPVFDLKGFLGSKT